VTDRPAQAAPPRDSTQVRCHVDLTAGRIRVYRLRRREPNKQPLLKTIPYQTPIKRFHE
jgi:hypothetical protein